MFRICGSRFYLYTDPYRRAKESTAILILILALPSHKLITYISTFSFSKKFFCYLKVPSGQIGSSWDWYHWIGLEKDINRYRFLIFFSKISFEYLKRLQSSEPLHTKMTLIILFVGITGCMGTNRNLFRQTVLQNAGESTIVLRITARE